MKLHRLRCKRIHVKPFVPGLRKLASISIRLNSSRTISTCWNPRTPSCRDIPFFQRSPTQAHP